MILKNFKRVFGKNYYPLNKITVSKTALVNNYKVLQSFAPEIQLAPVLKSNAYGHGLVLTAKIADQLGAPMLCVDSIYEAYELLKAKIKTPILIMGYINPQNLKVKKLPFSYAVFDISQLEVINKHQKGAEVHLKVDTGMHRLGIPMDELYQFVEKAKELKNVNITGLMSHIATPEEPKGVQTKGQIANFRKAIQVVESAGINLKWKHLAASEGVVRLGSGISKITNMARVGNSFYGMDLTGYVPDLKPALRLTSQIVQLKPLVKGDKVGYSGTFTAQKDVKLALLPIGYFDGIDRRLSNKGIVTVRGHACPIVGIVSMNITTIDVTGVKNVRVGDEVVIYSDDRNGPNSAQSAAEICKTRASELLVHLSPISIRREVV
ncbi:MAG: alanine racemase [Candidatus Curtissbacteria bacterium]|nr:alanine racemase [Candidatus Curtissbacteria bacterium]